MEKLEKMIMRKREKRRIKEKEIYEREIKEKWKKDEEGEKEKTKKLYAYWCWIVSERRRRERMCEWWNNYFFVCFSVAKKRGVVFRMFFLFLKGRGAERKKKEG